MEYCSYKRKDILEQAAARARAEAEKNQSKKPPKKPKNPHAGHRERVRESFRQSQGLGMRDSHLLEFLLFYSIPRRDTMPLALRLLEKFGSLEGVLTASPEQLMEVRGISTNTAALLRLTNQFLDTWEEACLRPETLLTTPQKQADYIRRAIAPDPKHLCLLCMNAECRPLSVNGWNHSELKKSAIQTILGDISLNHAMKVVVAFYQPDDPYLPTDEELMMVLNCTEAMSPFHVTLVDALFITNQTCVSSRRIHLLL